MSQPSEAETAATKALKEASEAVKSGLRAQAELAQRAALTFAILDVAAAIREQTAPPAPNVYTSTAGFVDGKWHDQKPATEHP